MSQNVFTFRVLTSRLPAGEAGVVGHVRAARTGASMLEALMDDLKAVETLPGLEGAIRKHLEQLGFDRFAYLALRLPHSTKAPYVVTTYPESWALHYHNQDYVNHDPVLLRATRTMQAFDWPTLSADPSLSPTQQRVLKEARDFDIAKGATVPVHAPGGGFATLSVASTAMSEAEFQREWKRLWPHVHLTALYSQSAVENRLLDTDQYQAFFLRTRTRMSAVDRAREDRGRDLDDPGDLLGDGGVPP
jgi:hypothetical protein